MTIKLLLAHIAISLLAIPLLGVVGNDLVCILLFSFSLLLYFLSGYIFTTHKTHWYQYFIVAIIGIVAWIFCYAISPDSTEWKKNPEAGYWLYYELFILVRSPLNFIGPLNEHYTLRNDLLFKFFIPIVLSLTQFSGGMYKLKIINKK